MNHRIMDNKTNSMELELSNIRKALYQSAIVAITDQHGTITHVNDRFCAISGYSREELLGKNHRLLKSGYHSHEFFEEMWRAISSGQTWEGEIRNRAKTGHFYWVNTCIVPFLNAEGNPYQYVSIRYEITQRKEAEERLLDYAKKLEVSNRELQDFASIAAHDLQEPLRKVRAFADRVATKYKSLIPVEALEYLSRINVSAERMQRLIDDLLMYSRIVTKAQPFKEVDLGEIARGVLDDLEFSIEQSQGRIDVSELPQIEADPVQMRQLMQNLFANALKFHQQGVPPVVRVSSQEGTKTVRIEVSDNGIGFSEKYLDRIFTIFQRLHGRMEYEGTGVGLAVCRRIVERHGGTITAKSSEGQGATFIVELPKKQDKKE